MYTEWQLLDTLGPFFSAYGFRNWDLCLAEKGIVAFPRSLWVTVKAGVWAGLGDSGGMALAWGKSAAARGERILNDEGDPKWRRYTLPELESITARRCTGANEILVKRHGMKADVYGIGDRGHTESCRNVLKNFYQGLYREENF